MTSDERKLLVETSIALAALVELLANGEGIAELRDYRRKFHERFAPMINEAVTWPAETVTAGNS